MRCEQHGKFVITLLASIYAAGGCDELATICQKNGEKIKHGILAFDCV